MVTYQTENHWSHLADSSEACDKSVAYDSSEAGDNSGAGAAQSAGPPLGKHYAGSSCNPSTWVPWGNAGSPCVPVGMYHPHTSSW